MGRIGLIVLVGVWVGITGCGGGGGGSGSATNGETPPASAPNVLPVSVNAGLLGNYANGIFTSVKVCVPGTSDCQTIDNILVDTGAYGLRLLTDASGGALTLSLPQETDGSGDPIVECTRFVDNSYLWGSVRTADVEMSGEQAASVPVVAIGDPLFPDVPGTCSTGGTNRSDLQGLGANGHLGVGLFEHDCGTACAPGGISPPPPGVYYTCPASGCEPALVSLAQQVRNPVPGFAEENNGVILELPAVPAAGVDVVRGSLILGIGTQENNDLGSATVYAANPLTGNFTTVFNGTSYGSSFIDSGSNALFFLDSATTGVPECGSGAPGFYCPTTVLSFTATARGVNGTTGAVDFSVASATSLFASGHRVFSNLAGPSPGSFDWGLPFFFGRRVFIAVEGQDTPAGSGPYWAY